MKASIKDAYFNKHNLSILPSGYGHWRIECDYRGKRIGCVTTDSEAIDDYRSDGDEKRYGCNRMKMGYETLVNKIIDYYNKNK